MFRSLRKVAASFEKGVETAFSTPPSSHTAFVGATFTISGIKIKLGPVFAEGGYSLLHVAKPVHSSSTSNNAHYAVKRISCEDPEARKQAEHEIAFLRQLPAHPNIVRFYDAVFQNNHAFLLFEFVDGGTLPDRLKSASLDSRRRLTIFADAVAAVAHLHAQNPAVAARDVKLENLLYDRLQGCYKLCDFGSVTTKVGRLTSRKEILATEEDIASNCTAMYRAPELVDLYSKQFICERVDVWALGCVWYAILFGSLPFDGQSSLEICKGLQDIPLEPTYPHEFISLLNGMLTVDPAERMDSFSVLEAVNRLQGKDIDRTLRSIGLELRRKRSTDFGGTSAQELTSSSSNLFNDRIALPAQPLSASQVSLAVPTASSTEDAVRDSRASHKQVFEHSSKDEAEEWADFEAAFGDPPSASQDATISSTTKNPTVTLPGRIPDRVSAATESSAPLIDFSDLQIASQTPRCNPTDNKSNQICVQSKSRDGRSTSNVTDLIDFG